MNIDRRLRLSTRNNVPLSALVRCSLSSALVALAVAIIALADVCGCARIAASAELSKRGVKRALKLFCNSGGEFSGSVGCTSRYRIDSVDGTMNQIQPSRENCGDDPLWYFCKASSVFPSLNSLFPYSLTSLAIFSATSGSSVLLSSSVG